MTKTNMTNSAEDQFNKSLIPLLNGQNHLQKHLLNMKKDVTCRYKKKYLMRDISIYVGKSIELADWLL